LDARDESIDCQLFRTHARERCQATQEDMVDSVEGVGFFEGHEVARLLDHADGRVITARVAADCTNGLVGLGEVKAHLAVLDLLFGGADRVGEFEGLIGGASEHVVSEPLGGLGADAGKTSQCGDQSIDGARVSGDRHDQ
jgi:hypothetical protein